MHARSLAATLAGLLLLGGCHRKPAPAAAPRPFSLADALEQWYGRYDAATQTARASLPEHPSIELAGSWFAANDPIDIVAVFDAEYTQAGRQRHIVVTAAVPHRSDKPGRPGDESFHCLSCRPVIGAAIFTLRKNTWLLESENAAADVAGGMGLPPAIRLVSLGTDLRGLRLESHIEARDFAGSSLSLLVPEKQTILRAFAGDTAYSNRNDCGPESPLRDPCYAWQRTDAFVDVPAQDYDDLTLTGSGTQPNPAIIHAEAERAPAKRARAHRGQTPSAPPPPDTLPYTAVERLRFHDGRYVPLPDTDTSIPEH